MDFGWFFIDVRLQVDWVALKVAGKELPEEFTEAMKVIQSHATGLSGRCSLSFYRFSMIFTGFHAFFGDFQSFLSSFRWFSMDFPYTSWCFRWFGAIS